MECAVSTVFAIFFRKVFVVRQRSFLFGIERSYNRDILVQSSSPFYLAFLGIIEGEHHSLSMTATNVAPNLSRQDTGSDGLIAPTRGASVGLSMALLGLEERACSASSVHTHHDGLDMEEEGGGGDEREGVVMKVDRLGEKGNGKRSAEVGGGRRQRRKITQENSPSGDG